MNMHIRMDGKKLGRGCCITNGIEPCQRFGTINADLLLFCRSQCAFMSTRAALYFMFPWSLIDLISWLRYISSYKHKNNGVKDLLSFTGHSFDDMSKIKSWDEVGRGVDVRTSYSKKRSCFLNSVIGTWSWNLELEIILWKKSIKWINTIIRIRLTLYKVLGNKCLQELWGLGMSDEQMVIDELTQFILRVWHLQVG